MFPPKREKIVRDWRELNNEQLHRLYSSPNLIQIITSIRMIWTGHAARMRHTRTAYRGLVGKKERDLDVDGKMMLNWFLET
jgi:hypothetical protein